MTKLKLDLERLSRKVDNLREAGLSSDYKLTEFEKEFKDLRDRQEQSQARLEQVSCTASDSIGMGERVLDYEALNGALNEAVQSRSECLEGDTRQIQNRLQETASKDAAALHGSTHKFMEKPEMCCLNPCSTAPKMQPKTDSREGNPRHVDMLQQECSSDALYDRVAWHGWELRLLNAIEVLLKQSLDTQSRDLRDMLSQVEARSRQDERAMVPDELLTTEENMMQENKCTTPSELNVICTGIRQPSAQSAIELDLKEGSPGDFGECRSNSTECKSDSLEFKDAGMQHSGNNRPNKRTSRELYKKFMEGDLERDSITVTAPGLLRNSKDCSQDDFENFEDPISEMLEYMEYQQAFEGGSSQIDKLLPSAKNCAKKCKRLLRGIQEPRRTGRVAGLVHSGGFEAACQLVIILNAAVLAYKADWQVRHIDMEMLPILDFLETSFLTFFLLELLLRLKAHGFYFFVNDNMRFNIFDFFLVTISWWDFIMEQMTRGVDERFVNLAFMRLFRLLKLARVLFSLRLFGLISSLTVLLDAFVHSMVPPFWGCLMFTFVMYIFSLSFLDGVIGYIKSEDNIDPVIKAHMEFKFGSLGRTIFSLFKAVSGGEDWHFIYDLLQEAGPMYGILFIVFFLLSTFAIANLITALVVEKAMAAAEPSKLEQVLRQRKKLAEEKHEFLAICRRMDKNCNGKVSWAEFEEWVQTPLMIAYMASIDLDIYDAKVFFASVANKNGHGMNSLDTAEVSIERFVEGCMQMKGGATAMDMQRSLVEMDMLAQDLKKFEQLFSDRMLVLEKKVSHGSNFFASAEQYPQGGTTV